MKFANIKSSVYTNSPPESLLLYMYNSIWQFPVLSCCKQLQSLHQECMGWTRDYQWNNFLKGCMQ